MSAIPSVNLSKEGTLTEVLFGIIKFEKSKYPQNYFKGVKMDQLGRLFKLYTNRELTDFIKEDQTVFLLDPSKGFLHKDDCVSCDPKYRIKPNVHSLNITTTAVL